MLEQRGRYVDAASRLHELSLSSLAAGLEDLPPSERVGLTRIECLRRALLSCLLAPAGRPRTRLLVALYTDLRSTTFPALFAVLENMSAPLLSPPLPSPPQL